VLGLKGMHVEETACKIMAYLGRLQSDFGRFQDDFETLGAHLSHAKRKYDEAERKLERLDMKLQQATGITAGELPEGEGEETQKELFP